MYRFFVDGAPLTAYLVTKYEAADPGLYHWIYNATGLAVHAIGVAAGHGEAEYPYQQIVIDAPMYHKAFLADRYNTS